MLNFLLPLLKNPLTKMVISKASSHFQHKAEKTKIIRAAEIESIKTISVEQIRQQEHSWKDEWLVVFFTLLLACHFIPYTQDTELNFGKDPNSPDRKVCLIKFTVANANPDSGTRI